jgi:hypothetical protein
VADDGLRLWLSDAGGALLDLAENAGAAEVGSLFAVVDWFEACFLFVDHIAPTICTCQSVVMSVDAPNAVRDNTTAREAAIVDQN